MRLPILAVASLAVCFFWAPSCAGETAKDDGPQLVSNDKDGDGYEPPEDCDDNDDDINPGAPELCNDEDDNCDGQIDEDVGDIFYLDADGDGYGNDDVYIESCDQPSGYQEYGGDCNDENAEVGPNTYEACNGIDDDCNGEIDDDNSCPCTVHHDKDGNAYLFCIAASDWVTAQNYCSLLEYEMITISTPTEQEFLASVLPKYGAKRFWIGYNDQETADSWVWDDGTNSDYNNWCEGEPVEKYDGDCTDETVQNCSVLDGTNKTGCWTSYPCTCAQIFIACELPS